MKKCIRTASVGLRFVLVRNRQSLVGLESGRDRYTIYETGLVTVKRVPYDCSILFRIRNSYVVFVMNLSIPRVRDTNTKYVP